MSPWARRMESWNDPDVMLALRFRAALRSRTECRGATGVGGPTSASVMTGANRGGVTGPRRGVDLVAAAD